MVPSCTPLALLDLKMQEKLWEETRYSQGFSFLLRHALGVLLTLLSQQHQSLLHSF